MQSRVWTLSAEYVYVRWGLVTRSPVRDTRDGENEMRRYSVMRHHTSIEQGTHDHETHSHDSVPERYVHGRNGLSMGELDRFLIVNPANEKVFEFERADVRLRGRIAYIQTLADR
jgi:hypothetical protein